MQRQMNHSSDYRGNIHLVISYVPHRRGLVFGCIQCALFGVTETFIVHNGKLLLGGSQGFYFLEFDGPRNSEFYVKVVED